MDKQNMQVFYVWHVLYLEKKFITKLWNKESYIFSKHKNGNISFMWKNIHIVEKEHSEQ